MKQFSHRVCAWDRENMSDDIKPGIIHPGRVQRPSPSGPGLISSRWLVNSLLRMLTDDHNRHFFSIELFQFIWDPIIQVYLGDIFYCTQGVLSSECPFKTCFTVQRVSSHQSVPWRPVLLYRGCPLIRVSLEDLLHCTEGVLSSECPFKTCFTV